MSLLSSRGQLALTVTVMVAQGGAKGPVPTADLTKELDLSKRHLEPLLSLLTNAGILRSKRGPGGGYQLARKAHRITCADVLRASGVYQETPFGPKTAEVLEAVERDFLVQMEAITIAEIMARLEPASA